MAVVSEAIRRLRRLKGQHVAIAIWSEVDVLDRATERGIKLTRSQSREIIDRIDDKQDCELGISWMTLDCFIDEVVHPFVLSSN